MAFDSHKSESPMKAPGCVWEFWQGVIGITATLCVFEADIPVGYAGDLSDRSRKALANYMIALWTRFRDEPNPKKSRPIR